MHRPKQGEYAPYYEPYIQRVPRGDILPTLIAQMAETVAFVQQIPDERYEFRYAAGKWSIKEVIGHVTDTERIMAYRLLRIARGDSTSLSGFDENLYVQGANYGRLSMKQLLDDFSTVRQATVTLLQTLSDEAWTREGTANDAKVSARAIAYIIAGHELHHRLVIEEKYVASL